jgi:hypothetical protein
MEESIPLRLLMIIFPLQLKHIGDDYRNWSESLGRSLKRHWSKVVWILHDCSCQFTMNNVSIHETYSGFVQIIFLEVSDVHTFFWSFIFTGISSTVMNMNCCKTFTLQTTEGCSKHICLFDALPCRCEGKQIIAILRACHCSFCWCMLRIRTVTLNLWLCSCLIDSNILWYCIPVVHLTDYIRSIEYIWKSSMVQV